MARLRPERLRDRIFAAALAVTALPFVVLVSMNRWEIRQADLAAEGGARALSAFVARAGTSPGWPELQRWVERDALLSGMRLRAVRADGARLLDVDRTLAPTFALGLGNFFYGPAAPGLASFDEEMGPLADRPESARGRAEPRVSQRFASKANLLSWASAQWLDGHEPVLLHVQAYSRRAALPGVVESRQVMKLLSLALALAVFSGWVLSRQLIKPLASLRQEVLRRATEAVPAATIDLGRRDEVGDVADAFNTLLAALNQRTKANEVFLTDPGARAEEPGGGDSHLRRGDGVVWRAHPRASEEAERSPQAELGPARRAGHRVP
jgi:HAMP domain-containing protein